MTFRRLGPPVDGGSPLWLDPGPAGDILRADFFGAGTVVSRTVDFTGSGGYSVDYLLSGGLTLGPTLVTGQITDTGGQLAWAAPVAYPVAVSFAGSGALDLTVDVIPGSSTTTRAVNFTGAGALWIDFALDGGLAFTVPPEVTGTLAEGEALTFLAPVTYPVAPAFGGDGDLAVGRVRRLTRAVQFSGAGDLALDVTAPPVGSVIERAVQFAGAGHFDTDWLLSGGLAFTSPPQITGTFALGEALTFDAPVAYPAAVDFGGAGTLVVDRIRRVARALAFTGAGDLALDVEVIPGGAVVARDVDFSGVGTFEAARARTVRRDVDMAGSGDLQVDRARTLRRSVDFSGSGDLQLDISVAGVARREVDFAGAGALEIDRARRLTRSVDFGGAGALAVDRRRTVVRGAAFTGSGTLAATRRRVVTRPAVFDGAGALAVDRRRRVARDAAFAGQGSLDLATQRGLTRAAVFAGSGSLDIFTSSGLISRRRTALPFASRNGGIIADSTRTGFVARSRNSGRVVNE